jgi:xanthine dehydrogenase accessory factor
MAFTDAWFDGATTLDGIEARRADLNAEFYLGLGTRASIPILTHPFLDVSRRWPWDVIIGSRSGDEPIGSRLKSLATLTIGLGAGFTAGLDCEIVVDVDGPDYGAIFRKGAVPAPRRRSEKTTAKDTLDMTAPVAGLFYPFKEIGSLVDAGEPIGIIGETIILAPGSGRICGLIRKGRAVVAGTLIAGITKSNTARVAGISNQNQLIASGAAFAVEMEIAGCSAIEIETWRMT